jgi:integrase
VSIHKDANGRYLVRWREGGRQLGRRFDRKRDAETFEGAMRQRAQLGAYAPAVPSREALSAWIEAWWDQEEPGWAASTAAVREAILDKWITPYLGHVPMRELGRERVKIFRAEIRAAGCSAKQTNEATSLLSAILGRAVEAGRLPGNPCAGLRRLPTRVERPRALSPIEAEKIRAALPTLRDRALWGLMYAAGLRPEEALALRWRSVGSVLTIDEAFSYGELKGTKTNRRRTVPVAGPLADDLALLGESVAADPDALVVPNRDGGHLHLGNWRRRVSYKATAAAGVTATPYDGRHTYVSLLVNAGLTPAPIAARSGHSVEEMWRTYAHLFEGADELARVPIDDALASARASVAARGVHGEFTAADPEPVALDPENDESPLT